MATEIRVPTLGESVTEATIGKWFKKAGRRGRGRRAAGRARDRQGDASRCRRRPPACSSEIAAKDGETVAVGALLGQIKEARAPRKAQRRRRPAGPTRRPRPRRRSAPPRKQPRPRAQPKPRPPDAEARRPTPLAARRCASSRPRAASIPPRVPGSGKDGRVTKGDMLAAIERAASAPTPVAQPAAAVQVRAPSPADDAAREERVKMTRLRQTIARRLKDAQNTAAMLTTFNEVDMSAVMELRNQYKDLFEKKHGVKLGFMGFFVKACVQALKEIPAVNAEIDGTDIIYKNYYHIGVAVGTEKGLVVPVVRDCRPDVASPRSRRTIADFGKRARDGTLKIEEMQGGTFTITNGGVYGSLMSTPILNAPQSGILGMHKIQERPVVVAGKIEIAADDVSRAVLRPPHRRRQRGGDLPGAGQGSAGGPGAAGAGFVRQGRSAGMRRHVIATSAAWSGGECRSRCRSSLDGRAGRCARARRHRDERARCRRPRRRANG